MGMRSPKGLLVPLAVDRDADLLVSWCRRRVREANGLSNATAAFRLTSLESTVLAAQKLQIFINSGLRQEDMRKLAWNFGGGSQNQYPGPAGLPPPPSTPSKAGARGQNYSQQQYYNAASATTTGSDQGNNNSNNPPPRSSSSAARRDSLSTKRFKMKSLFNRAGKSTERAQHDPDARLY